MKAIAAVLMTCAWALAQPSPADLNRVQTGQPAPDFTLEDPEGRPVTLSAYRGRKNVILVFYRGHW